MVTVTDSEGANAAKRDPDAGKDSFGGQAAAKKTVIVMGAGIAGLACAYELKRRGHDVKVLEASGRAGRSWPDLS
jgi:NADPH-dependent 2,4-dienoyl-CoA reductase/sulfur reductase-like enzyme